MQKVIEGLPVPMDHKDREVLQVMLDQRELWVIKELKVLRVILVHHHKGPKDHKVVHLRVIEEPQGRLHKVM